MCPELDRPAELIPATRDLEQFALISFRSEAVAACCVVKYYLLFKVRTVIIFLFCFSCSGYCLLKPFLLQLTFIKRNLCHVIWGLNICPFVFVIRFKNSLCSLFSCDPRTSYTYLCITGLRNCAQLRTFAAIPAPVTTIFVGGSYFVYISKMYGDAELSVLCIFFIFWQ